MTNDEYRQFNAGNRVYLDNNGDEYIPPGWAVDPDPAEYEPEDEDDSDIADDGLVWDSTSHRYVYEDVDTEQTIGGDTLQEWQMPF